MHINMHQMADTIKLVRLPAQLQRSTSGLCAVDELRACEYRRDSGELVDRVTFAEDLLPSRGMEAVLTGLRPRGKRDGSLGQRSKIC